MSEAPMSSVRTGATSVTTSTSRSRPRRSAADCLCPVSTWSSVVAFTPQEGERIPMERPTDGPPPAAENDATRAEEPVVRQEGESVGGDGSAADVETPRPSAAADYAPLGEFTLDLAKAMLRTGYYSPDHPQSKQSLAGLHAELRRVLGDLPGITYLVQERGEKRDILIEGYGESPLALDDIMIRGMAELFRPKLLDFFNRRRLKSFSVRPGIETDEFNAFVILMSEPPRAGKAREERQRVAQALVDQNIIHVSTVFEADLLGKDRRLPWRVQLAISRLGRDLQMLPLFKHATPEQMKEIKIQILDEVIRPMRTPELLKDLLVNCDLLAKDITVLQETQIEREILRQVPRPLLVPAAWEIIRDLEDLDDVPDDEASASGGYMEQTMRHRLPLKDILDELIDDACAIESELLEAMIAKDLCDLEGLPAALQVQVKRYRMTDIFLQRADDYLNAFRNLPAGKKGEDLARVALHVFPELLRRGRYRDAGAVLETVSAGGQDEEAGRTIAELFRSLRQSVRDEDTIERLVEALGDKDLDRLDRDAAVVILGLAGEKAAAELRALYAAARSQTVRGSAFDAMRRIGGPALEGFLSDLADSDEEWPAIHHILGALEDQTDPALAEPIKRFLDHENEHVRHAAITLLFKLAGAEAEEYLITALEDPDASTRRAAVSYLGQLRSRHPEVLAFYAAALGSDGPRQGSDQPEAVLVEVCRSLAGLGQADLGDGMGIEDVLLDALAQDHGKGLLGRLKKRSAHHNDKVRIAICEALGTVGTEAGAQVLSRLASADSPELADAAASAVEAIRARPVARGA